MQKLSFMQQNNTITSVVIGKFDGLHRAHRKLFSYLDDGGAILVVQTENENLTPGDIKQEFTSFPIFTLDFEEIKNLSGEDFFAHLQFCFPHLKKIVVGYDFRCGRNRSFGACDIARVFKGTLEIVPEIHYQGVAVHAENIRSLLMAGEIAKANDLLGRAYMIEGDWIKGQGIGSKELVATLNLDVQQFLIPKEGVYCTYTQLNDDVFDSISFVGKRVSVDSCFAIETHLLDAQITQANSSKQELLSKKIPQKVRLYFLHYLRENHKFETLPELKKQILQDIQKTKEFHSYLKKQKASLLYNSWYAREGGM